MEILRYTSNAWGQSALEGLSWDLIPVFVAAGVLFIAMHMVYKIDRPAPVMAMDPATANNRFLRHLLVDRLYHWTMASAVLLLLGTGLLPILGIKFEWLELHWITGLVLTALIVAHVVRSLIWLQPAEMALRPGDLADLTRSIRAELSGADGSACNGKYSTSQKLYHLCSSLVVLAAIVTGLLMLLKIDTPWWERDPYLISQQNWGYVYVVHDLSSLLLISLIMVHVYFGIRPEKRFYTRSMWRGWITESEHRIHAYGMASMSKPKEDT